MEHDNIDKLLKSHWDGLYHYAHKLLHNKEDAEDAVAIGSYKVYEKGLSGIDNIQAYLYTVVRNTCMHMLKRRESGLRIANFPDMELMQETLPDGPESIPGYGMLRSEFVHYLWKDVEGLPDKYRTIFKMRTLENRTYVEIAALLDLTPQTVSDRYDKAVRQLRMNVFKRDLAPCIILILLALAAALIIF